MCFGAVNRDGVRIPGSRRIRRRPPTEPACRVRARQAPVHRVNARSSRVCRHARTDFATSARLRDRSIRDETVSVPWHRQWVHHDAGPFHSAQSIGVRRDPHQRDPFQPDPYQPDPYQNVLATGSASIASEVVDRTTTVRARAECGSARRLRADRSAGCATTLADRSGSGLRVGRSVCCGSGSGRRRSARLGSPGVGGHRAGRKQAFDGADERRIGRFIGAPAASVIIDVSHA